jgi:hypothetical protein
MANGVHPAVNAVKLTALNPSIDGPSPAAGPEQLSPRHNPVLPLRQVRDPAIHPNAALPQRTRTAFFIPQLKKAVLAGHPTDRDPARRTCGAHGFKSLPRPAHEKCTRAKNRPQPAVAASGFDPFK